MFVRKTERHGIGEQETNSEASEGREKEGRKRATDG